MYSYHITFRPTNCDGLGYVLQPKDIDTLHNYVSKHSKQYIISQEKAGTTAHHLHSAFILSQNKRPTNIKQQLLNQYKKYINFAIGKSGFNPAIKVKSHPIEQFYILAGGYVSKDNDILFSKGLDKDLLEEGGNQHQKLCEGKNNRRIKVLTIKNFYHLVSDYMTINNINIIDYNTVHRFLYGILKPMFQQHNYKTIISPSKIKELILQLISTDNTLDEFFAMIEGITTQVLDKDQYIRVMEKVKFDLD